MIGGNGWIRTSTLLRMKEVHDHYATLPYKNTLKSAARKALYPRWSMTRPNVFLYGKLIVDRNRTCVCLFSEAFLPLEDYEFLRAITSQHGCHRPMAFTILKYSAAAAVYQNKIASLLCINIPETT